MKKEDSRVSKTKKKIKEAFLELIEIKGYSHVSVCQIVKKANINRNTFYLHYQDKEDLAKKLLYEASFKLNQTLGLDKNQFNINNLTKTHIQWRIRKLLHLISPEIEFYRIIILDKSLRGLINELYEMIKKHFSFTLNIKNPCSNLIFEYTFTGMIGLIQQWILYSPTNEYETARILAQLTYENMCQFYNLNQ